MIKFFKRKKTKKGKIFDKLFTISGIATFILLFFLFLGTKSEFLSFSFPEMSQGKEETGEGRTERETKYSIAAQKSKDPFITKNPDVADDFLVRPSVNNPLNPSLGSKEAKVTIVEFSDFTCEFCQKQEDVLREVVEKYEGEIRLIWKNYPDPSGISLQAAVAGHCAHLQGKFWQYHDLLFSKSKDLDSDLLLKLAKKLDLDSEVFTGCLYNETSFERILEDIREADGLRIAGVPFFFVGDQEILGEINREDLERIIEIELYGD